MYFNQKFDLSALEMRRIGVFNPRMEQDSELFVDPKLLESGGPEFHGSRKDLIAYFQETVDLIKLSEQKEDRFWNAAVKRTMAKEKASAGLGYSKNGKSGNGIGKVLAGQIVACAAEILPTIGYKPNIFELIGVFAENLGCDRLSDMVLSILASRFYAYAQRVAGELGIHQLRNVSAGNSTFAVPCFSEKEGPIMLLPKAILQPLPIAADIGEALDKAELNEGTRNELNAIWSEAAKTNRVPGKKFLRQFVSSKPKIIYEQILEGYEKAEVKSYDFDKDPRDVSDFNALAREIVGPQPAQIAIENRKESVEALLTCVLRDLRKLIEENRLSDLLFNDDGSPRKESMSQRLIYAIADIYSRIYDVDIGKEPNAGNGPADFKFSVGREARILIEVKLSTHERIQDGYYFQLPAYARSEDIKRLVLLVVQVDESTAKLEELEKIMSEDQEKRIQLEIVDARRKPSASKLRR
jgi:hypothetical protein